jgi:hypothetical protein
MSTSTLGITGTLTLDAGGNANAQFIFQIASGLTTATNSNVVLINGAQAGNVFWQVGSSAVLGTSSTLSGNILAQASISLGTGAVLQGRALARTGAVTLLSNTVTSPAGPGGPSPGPPTPAPSSLILVTLALACAGIYQARERLLKPFRRN